VKEEIEKAEVGGKGGKGGFDGEGERGGGVNMSMRPPSSEEVVVDRAGEKRQAPARPDRKFLWEEAAGRGSPGLNFKEGGRKKPAAPSRSVDQGQAYQRRTPQKERGTNRPVIEKKKTQDHILIKIT